MDLRELEWNSLQYRKQLLTVIRQAGAGHIGGGLSCLDILNVLYNRVLNVQPGRMDDPDRDRYVQSKGHAVEALYVVLADRGFFPIGESGRPEPVWISVHRPPDAEDTGHRAQHRRAGARTVGRGRDGAGGEAGRPALSRIRLAGRRRAGRRFRMGGVHECGALRTR